MAMKSSSSLASLRAMSTGAYRIQSLSRLVSQIPRASFTCSSAAMPCGFGLSQPATLRKSVGDDRISCSFSEFSVRNRSSYLLRRNRTRLGRARAGDDGGECDPDSEKGKTFVVTTPLYYVNAAPHMGSAYPTIAADALARFQRLQGRKVVFITGTDEHGEKIATSAAAQGRQPKEHCDLVAAEYQALWKELGISYDRFIRTTEVNHEKIVDEFYHRVLDNGDIYRADYEGLLCEL